MPTFQVQIEVSVPGLAVRQFTQAGIQAASMEEAITVAKALVVISPLQAQRTAA